MRNKKATTVTHFLIAIIIIAISAAIIFIFLSYNNWKKESRIEACHEQIVYRHTFNIGSLELGRETIPLSACRAGHVCFVTSKNEDCKELKGLEDIEKIKVEDKGEIIKELAERMAVCWNMVGGGNLKYQPKGEWLELEHNYCGICDKIAFSEELNKEIDKIYLKEIYDYMSENTVSGTDKTYIQYLYKRDSLDEIRKTIEEYQPEREFKGEKDIYKYYIDTSNGHAIITSISRPGWVVSVLGGATALAGGIAFMAVTGLTGGVGGVIIITIGSATGGAIGGNAIISLIIGDEEYTPPQIVIYDPDHLEVAKKLKCDTFNFLP